MQDALYDAEEYLRSELAENPGKSEADVIAAVAGSYGAPDEVADIYRDTEIKVQTALRPPAPPPRKSALGRFFGVIAEPRTYAALFYMLLSLATGLFYFSWVVTGRFDVAGPGGADHRHPVRDPVLRLGARAVAGGGPHRRGDAGRAHAAPAACTPTRGQTVTERIKELFTDPRIWGTQLYFLLMLPLGIALLHAGGHRTERVAVADRVADRVAARLRQRYVRIDGDGLILQSEPWAWPLAIVGRRA